jgi:cellulose synthase/poly-beta-1,6-N-acetylglucosamine synthase-like glycosyltransferase
VNGCGAEVTVCAMVAIEPTIDCLGISYLPISSRSVTRGRRIRNESLLCRMQKGDSMAEKDKSKSLSVAICIGTYNQAQYLKSSVESALAQTHPIEEIWVSDDCSTDNTSEVMAEICRRHPKIQY